MKILLIDNHTDYLYNFAPLFRDHFVEIQEYRPGLDFHVDDKELVILSGGGGEGFELRDQHNGRLWYEDQIKFILGCNKPLVGICMGFEVISAAFGAKIQKVDKRITGFKTHKTSRAGKKRLSLDSLRQYEHHEFVVPGVSSKHFEILADSPTGIEMIKHKQRKIVATQFHPEVTGGTLSLKSVLANLTL